MSIAFDAMGGDTPLSVKVEAAIGAIEDFGIDVILVGLESKISQVIDRYHFDRKKLHIVNSTEIVEMNESPSSALRQKKDSSIRIAVNLVESGEAEAVVSAGNTGASMATANSYLNQLKV